ncbi:MAG: hypothetical protein A2Z12_07415 [Actinobacteria bacterium RBG_16_68_21]|nr:MAG: hypothetical protein A2Z12_07415 [Actinobacteria bacterium RBG_16_68_21]
MAEVIALRAAWTDDYILATPSAPHPAGIDRLPTEWSVIDGAVVGGTVIDHVVVGPNGVFTINVDPDPRPASVGEDGLYRDGARVTTTVKQALMAASRLRQQLGQRVFAYPILVSRMDAPRHQLDRLGVVPGDAIAEYIWSHPGLPMRRSQRLEVQWALRRPLR